ncbi:MAG: type II secretion system F family protein [Nitrososphaerota archaeon]|nr:type II secretion system F family protein [Nitrososphaerota archaeon]
MGEGVGRSPVGLLMGAGPVQRIVDARSTRFAELLKRSGTVGNPAEAAAASVRRALLSALVAVPAACLLGALFSPWLLVPALAPLAFVLGPELRLRDLVAQRKEGVERELPFFATMVSVLGGAGVPLYSVLRELAGEEAFAWLGKEARLVKRDVDVLGMNPYESFERLAETHPSRRFADFLLGYTSKARSGGDVPFYLVEESGGLLADLEDGWTRYVARVGIVGSMMITVFGIVPLLLMVVGVFSPGVSIVGLLVFTGVGVPAFTVALLFMTGRMQPAREEGVRGRAAAAMALALPAALTGVLTKLAWVGVASALLAFFVLYGASVREQLSETRGVDEGLARFLRDLLEYKRQEYDLSKAVVALEARGRYNPHFSRLLARVAAQLRAGVPLDEVRVECRSSLGKTTFLLLGQMSRSGGGTVDTVYQMSSFAGKLTGMRQKAGTEMKPYLVLSYVSPLLLAFGVTFVQGVLTSFSGRVAPGFSALRVSGIQLGTVPPGLPQVSDLLIVVSAASLGLIGAKISDLTVKNTLRASLNVALAVAAVGLMAALGPHSLTGAL